MEPTLSFAESVAPPEPSASPANATRQPQPATLAPWYHTVGIVLLLLVYGLVAHLTHRAPGGLGTASSIERRVSETARALADAPKVPLYLSTMMLSWMLLASVVAGLYHRRAFFLTTLRRRFRSLWVDPALGLGLYATFFMAMSMFLLLFTALVISHTHTAETRVAAPSAATQKSANPQQQLDPDVAAAEAIAEAHATQQRVGRMLRMNGEAVVSLAPRTLPEMLLWIALSATAGFCEEHIFRGYLLSQSLAAMRRVAMPPWLASTLSVLTTSVLFGGLHLYQGIGGAVVIAILGALFATAALVLGNLRAVIVAHFLQDFLGGLTLYIAHLRHAL